MRKKNIENEIEVKNNQIRQLILTQSLLKNNLDNTKIQCQKIIDEKGAIELEKARKETVLEKSKIELNTIEVQLRDLREKENEIIQSTGSTYTKLQEFERTYRKLTENEKKTVRELNLLEKEIAIINKNL